MDRVGLDCFIYHPGHFLADKRLSQKRALNALRYSLLFFIVFSFFNKNDQLNKLISGVPGRGCRFFKLQLQYSL